MQQFRSIKWEFIKSWFLENFFFNIQHLYSFNVIINPSLIYGFQLFSQGYNMDNDIISWSFHSPVGGKGMGCIIILASWEFHFFRENINIWCNILVVIYLLFSRYMLYDPDTGKVLTRTPMSWFKIITFYCIYYTLLAGFWLACLHVFFLTIPEDTPR